jgi:hypothetical protein
MQRFLGGADCIWKHLTALHVPKRDQQDILNAHMGDVRNFPGGGGATALKFARKFAVTNAGALLGVILKHRRTTLSLLLSVADCRQMHAICLNIQKSEAGHGAAPAVGRRKRTDLTFCKRV